MNSAEHPADQWTAPARPKTPAPTRRTAGMSPGGQIMSIPLRTRRRTRWPWLAVLGGAALAGAAAIPMTFQDFHLSGTQIGGVNASLFRGSDDCRNCHGDFDYDNEPFFTWKGSLMGNAGRDPLFYAQMTTASQDVANVGYFCLRCHVPMSFVTAHAYQPDGSTLDDVDKDGVTCHFCHSMVDPIYKPGISPPEDLNTLNQLAQIPAYYGNAMFVLDTTATRRGPYGNVSAPHSSIHAPFVRTGEFCRTCHDVGNVAVTKQQDGTYAYNALDTPTPDENPHTQFPLERTYTEWKLSTFANGGVDMHGRFGGVGATVVSTCQDCHMPRTTAQGCYFGPTRSDLARHDFAGASSWVLEIIGLHYQDDGNVDQDAILAARAKAVDMVQRSATLELTQACGALRVRITNECGHKLPTGHIEGRRVWLNVKFFDASDQLIGEYGHYDASTAHLDEESTHVYEMKIGISPQASQITGLPAGETTHMSLADVIVKDSRIPPRGFINAAYEAGGAPAVAWTYADGQYWDDAYFSIPPGAVRAEATANYQTVTRHYIEALRDGNVTDQWGNILYNLWEQTGKGPPVPITTVSSSTASFTRGDMDCDNDVDEDDVLIFVPAVLGLCTDALHHALADMTNDARNDGDDIQPFVSAYLGN